MSLNSASVNVGDTATSTQYNNLRKDIVKLGGDFGTTTNSGNAYSLAIDSQFVLAAGVIIKFKINTTNTGASTLNVNAGGAIAAKKGGTLALQPGDFASGNYYLGIYDGTNWQIINISTLNRFGDQSDGNLTVSSNTTLNPSYKIFQYGNLTVNSGITLTFGANFQNKPILVLVNGDLTLNGATVSVNGLGATAGASAGLGFGASQQSNKSDYQFSNTAGWQGQQGYYSATPATATGGPGGVASGTPIGIGFFQNILAYKMIFIGSAGGSGGYGAKAGQIATNTGGIGGDGGGGIMFLVAGNVDVTNAVLTANGTNGVSGNRTDTTASGSGGGGGGQGGSFSIGYLGTLTGSPTTLTASKGVKGSGATIANGGQNAGGGGGGSGAGSGVAGSQGQTADVGIGGGNGSDGIDGYTQITKIINY